MRPSTPPAQASFANFTEQERATLLRVMCDSLLIRRHEGLFRWLQAEIQEFIPHDILIAAWGDFSLGLVHLDVVSYLPGMRTKDVDQKHLQPLLLSLFGQWVGSPRTPFAIALDRENRGLGLGGRETPLDQAVSSMHSALVQGIKDERGRHDCLYVAMSTKPSFGPRAGEAMQLLLPYIDTALRQVAHLPVQHPDLPEAPGEATAQARDDDALSEREQEIMHWVSVGKTNPEIGSILDISYFTVKNHLQRIYRKLEVINRAQAVVAFQDTYPDRRRKPRDS